MPKGGKFEIGLMVFCLGTIIALFMFKIEMLLLTNYLVYGLAISSAWIFAVIAGVRLGIIVFARAQQSGEARAVAQQIKEEAQQRENEIKSDPFLSLGCNIEEYLSNNQSTPFFREQLNDLLKALPGLKKKRNGLRSAVVARFGEGTMSYHSFMDPIEKIMCSLMNLGKDLVAKLEMFEEDKYLEKTKQFHASGRNEEAQEYESVLNQYRDFSRTVVDTFQKTDIRLDKMILELHKLNDEDIKKSAEGLEQVDQAIKNTKLYKA